MRRHLLIIGPVPPPIHGESLAIQNLIESVEINSHFKISIINTNRRKVTTGGKFSLKKILQDIHHIRQVNQEFREKKIDIVYLSLSQTTLGLLRDALIIRLVAKKKTKRIVAHLHGNNLKNVLDSLNPILTSFVFNSLRLIDTGIVLSQELSYNFKQLPRRIDVVSNGIRPNFFSDEEIELAKRNRMENHTFTILYLSNLIKDKGFAELIQACIGLLQKQFDVQLFLAGQIYDRQLFNEMMNQVIAQKVNGQIKYLGTVTGEKKKTLLLNANIMVLPTRYKIEGQPISIIEGMAAGLPIISTNQGAIPSLIERNGIILDEVNQSCIASAIERMMIDRELYQKFENNSRTHFLKNFTMDHYIQGLISIFTTEDL